jgi:hypothetical protein
LRKLWFRRRGVSTMIGGIIVLSLFLTALVAMILLNQEYDSYQGTVSTMKQADLNTFSESLRAVPPGLVKGNSTVGCNEGNCTAYTLMIASLVTNASANPGVQIARIYVNSTYAPGCVDPCILNPSTSPAPYTFEASQRYVNPGEPRHSITLWFPDNITLPSSVSGEPAYGANTVTITTTRGRQFSFDWPLPPPGLAAGGAGGEGGTGIYIGPLVITFQKDLITYSTQVNQTTLPIGGTNGGWILHTPPLIIYVKIQTDVGTPSDVYLTSQSVIELAKFDSPGEIYSWFIVAPISLRYCELFHNQDPTIICDSSYGYYNNTAAGNNGAPNKPTPSKPIGLKSYNDTSPDGKPCIPYNSVTCPNRYKIPRPTTQQLLRHERGNPVIVAFAAGGAGSNSPQTGGGGYQGKFVTSYLGLTYVYNDQSGKGDYTYAVTLPFMAMCMADTVSFIDCGI